MYCDKNSVAKAQWLKNNMKTKNFDVIVIGGGAAGMASALSVSKQGLKVCLIDREKCLGGILLQCIHNGFGLHTFKEELTGPEYAERFAAQVIKDKNIKIFLNSTAIQINMENKNRVVHICSDKTGISKISGKAIILAMGCRERNRGNIGIAGSRPSGIFTAGLAQRLINIDGFLPGKRVVIIGSGDIGLIMARRLTWVGAKVLGVVEIQSSPSGLTRNIVQCLNDYKIPLYLSHITSRIYGKDRVEKVEITPLKESKPDYNKSFTIECDTLLFSVGLIPDMDLACEAGVLINHDTNGPYADVHYMTNIDGIFACGNVLHVHDIVDFVAEEAEHCGHLVCDYIKGKNKKIKQYKITPGANIKYIIPNQYNPMGKNKFYLRSMIVKNNAELILKLNNREIKKRKLLHVQPSEMISFVLDRNDLTGFSQKMDNRLEVSIR